MSLVGARASLGNNTKSLLNKWAETKTKWRDAKGLEFEQKYIVELQSNVDRTITVIEELDKILAKVRKDCG